MSVYPSPKDFFEKNRSIIGDLVARFEGYLVKVTRLRMETYLRQFTLGHTPVALKLLQNVDYYTNEKTGILAKRLGCLIKQKTNKNLAEVYFCPIDRSSGSSTDVIIRKIRNSLGFDSAKYDDKFIRVSDLEKFTLGPQVQISNLKDRLNYIESLPDEIMSTIEREAEISDLKTQIETLKEELRNTKQKTIVFIDDFIGSGSSFVDFWATIGSYYNENNKYVLASLVAHQQGIDAIKSSISIEIITATKPIPYSSKIFHPKNKTFSTDEKKVLQSYCTKLGISVQHQYGFMDTQSLVIFYERSSNNTLPILYSDKNNWIPIFPRNI